MVSFIYNFIPGLFTGQVSCADNSVHIKNSGDWRDTKIRGAFREIRNLVHQLCEVDPILRLFNSNLARSNRVSHLDSDFFDRVYLQQTFKQGYCSECLPRFHVVLTFMKKNPDLDLQM